MKIGETHFGEFGLFVIADGMGGLAAGEVASGIIISTFKKWWEKWIYRYYFTPVISV